MEMFIQFGKIAIVQVQKITQNQVFSSPEQQ